ncbi:MAG: AbrB/MazE/SpoVT family DNA-binding domain-containing protein [Candidatus Methanofastidiosa archaeon]|nr:AbrB/MazE/SpoVT family DNA-binding domain-containing protein [Candidatus Methanofastidiosa archaeon]
MTKKKPKKGFCSHNQVVYGMTTVSERGQVVVPANIRRDLDIKTGDRFMVLKRGDNAGITLLKIDKMDELMFKIQQDEEFFKKVSGGENMPTCQDCKHYNPVDEETGNCFGVEVKADMDADDCPAKAFEPK